MTPQERERSLKVNKIPCSALRHSFTCSTSTLFSRSSISTEPERACSISASHPSSSRDHFLCGAALPFLSLPSPLFSSSPSESHHRMDPARLLCPSSDGRERVQKLLSLVEGRLSDATVEACLSSALLVGLKSSSALSTAISVYMRTRECESRQFVEDVLRPAIRVAGRFSALFAVVPQTVDLPNSKQPRAEGATAVRPVVVDVVSINMPLATFSREQVWCIVANAFLCTFDERDYDDLPSINFTEMHRARRRHNYVEITKLRLLFDYFRQLGDEEAAAAVDLRSPSLTVVRFRAPALAATLSAANGKPVLPCCIHKLGESIDDQDTMLRLDFANRWIGGGALSDGCVQEEITFAQCPELIAMRWFHGPLDSDEALLVSGHRQYSAVLQGTYGRDMRYGGCAGLPRQLGGALVGIDALDFRYRTTWPQFTPDAVARELQKLLSGLLAPLADTSSDVAGGNWGCGVFGGDVQLKFLIQWLACGLAGKQLHYFPFNLPYVEGMQPVVEYLAETASLDLTALAACLLDPAWLQAASKDGAWTALTQWLHSTQGITVPMNSSDSDTSSICADAPDTDLQAISADPTD